MNKMAEVNCVEFVKPNPSENPKPSIILPPKRCKLGDKLRKRDSPGDTYIIRQIVIDCKGVMLFLSLRGQQAMIIPAEAVDKLFERV